ncbi:hypothetical protein V5O48_003529 [Marasmius crinis-equi]|uniref:Aminoglycoside phosphotransferase domain-containing protein n=1 Tax=Marasmius crinis-equi TaxID=585013 RepID=A0ABR3FTG2_9AGAR
MVEIKFVILADDRPNNLPPPETIVQLCRAAGHDTRGVPLFDESRGLNLAWVKYGHTVTMSEAHTQDAVWQALNAIPDAPGRIPKVYQAFKSGYRGYIVMEYIDGSECIASDIPQVAAVVECLIGIKGPTAVPGPVGGGPIVHSFFVEWTSDLEYDTVQELEQHVNGILAYVDHSERVDFSGEIRDGLRLCPCDINQTNFLKDRQGRIVAIDFGATNFLPPSFFALAMAMALDDFTFQVSKHVKFPTSTNLNALLRASYALVPFGTNNIGVPRSLRKPK